MGIKLCSQPTRLSFDNALLSYVIETEQGLLDELYKCGVLNQQQIELLQNEESQCSASKVRKLLKKVKRMSIKRQEQFLTALEKTGQSHVTNFIRSNGQRPTNDPDNWPIYGLEEWNRVFSNRSQLIALTDTLNGLLDELLSARYINSQQRKSILEQPGDVTRNELLLTICPQKSVSDHEKFIDSLTKTKQHRVASLLMKADSFTTVQPVSEEHIHTLITHYPTLIELIDLKSSELSAELLSADAITWRQREHIESAETRSESSSRLLDIVQRGSEQDYLKFIVCLNVIGQSNVTNILCNTGVVAGMVAKTNLSTDEEDCIVQRFAESNGNAPPDSEEPIRRKLLHGIPATLQGGQLIAMKTKHSIKLFIFCTTLRRLQHLRELFITGRLETIIASTLTILLNRNKLVFMKCLIWNTCDYNELVNYFSVQHVQTVNSQLIPSLPINKLPHELLEHVLLKATDLLFVALKKMVSCAHIDAITTLHSVCLYWWETLTSRQTIRIFFIKYFNQQCAPYKFNPKQLGIICLQGKAVNVAGIAELFNKLFVACSMSNKLKVFAIFDSSNRYLGEEITVPELRRPTDVVACRVTNCLYIGDCDPKAECIWQVSSSSLFEDTTKVTVRKFSVRYSPLTMSVQCSRLLVTPSVAGDTEELYVHSCDDGELIKAIRLPRYMRVFHAAETFHKTVIVCFHWKIPDDYLVIEMSENGLVLRSYEREAMFEPWYVTIDSKNHVLVYDRYSRRILHLNRELELEHVVLIEELSRHVPVRACYSEESCRLYISYLDDDSAVNVYRV